jgi:ATP-dependent DNA helicase RecQ
MAYGLQDVVNQRRMIDESPAGEAYKQVMRGKLDALLALAEATDCRRVRLLEYFGEALPGDGPLLAGPGPLGGQRPYEAGSVGARYSCGNCDNCLSPPRVWDGTDAARKLLSTVYRVQQMSGISFGAGHVMDIVRGRRTDKTAQFGHEQVSTFGLGAQYSEAQLRSALAVDALAFNTLRLTEGSRAVLRGERQVLLRETVSHAAGAGGAGRRKRERAPASATGAVAAGLTEAGQARFAALKAWRSEVAKAHNLPAYVIFHDATLAAIAAVAPSSVQDLQGISGIGSRKLDAYGDEVLRVVRATA